MNIHFISYANSKYYDMQNLQIEKAAGVFDTAVAYTDVKLRTLHPKFVAENEEILNMERGAGYWIWKPYIIQDRMSQIPTGDVVLYMDVGDTFTPHLHVALHNHMQTRDYMLLSGCFTQEDWTKGDCFHLMGAEEEKYKKALQVEAGVCAFKKTAFNRQFIADWLAYCCDKFVSTDLENHYAENAAGFKDHRHDQSILTNLMVRHNMKSSKSLRPFINCNAVHP